MKPENMNAEQMYDFYRSMTCAMIVDAERDIWKRGMICGFMRDKLIIGFKDEDHPIKKFNNEAGSIYLPMGNGKFCSDGSQNKSFDLADPSEVGYLGSMRLRIEDSRAKSYVQCMADRAPIKMPAGIKPDPSLGFGWCTKHDCECFLHHNHTCAALYECELTRNKRDKEKKE